MSWRCITPTACPRESGGRPGVSSPSPRTARSGDPGPIPDSRGSPGSGSGAGPGRFALSPPAAAAAQNAAIVWFAAFRAASGIRDGSPPSGDDEKGAKARAARQRPPPGLAITCHPSIRSAPAKRPSPRPARGKGSGGPIRADRALPPVEARASGGGRRSCPPPRRQREPRRPARALRSASPPVRGGGRLQSSFLLLRPGAGSFSARIPRACARARRRAFRAGAVRAPDCAREAEGAPLLSASHGFSRNRRRPAAQHPGKRLRMSSSLRDHHSTIGQMSSPKSEIFHEKRTNFRRRPVFGPLLTAPGRAPCPLPLPCRRSGLRRWAARRSSGRDIA